MIAVREVLITGGAGFIGTNLANRLAGQGGQVLILDNLLRAGVEQNMRWLRETHGSWVRLVEADVRNSEVCHLAALHEWLAELHPTSRPVLMSAQR